MARKKSRLYMTLAIQAPPLSDKLQSTSILIGSRTVHFRNCQNSAFAPRSRKQHRKPPLITYPLCTLFERTVHLCTGCAELRSTPSSPMLPLLAPDTGCSIQSVMITGDLQTPHMARQRNKTLSLMVRAFLSQILLSRIKVQETDRRFRKTGGTQS